MFEIPARRSALRTGLDWTGSFIPRDDEHKRWTDGRFVDGDHSAATERVGDFLHPKDEIC